MPLFLLLAKNVKVARGAWQKNKEIMKKRYLRQLMKGREKKQPRTTRGPPYHFPIMKITFCTPHHRPYAKNCIQVFKCRQLVLYYSLKAAPGRIQGILPISFMFFLS